MTSTTSTATATGTAKPTTPAPKRVVLPALGQYRLVEELSRGAMGNVYLATLAAFNQLVVIKELPPELSDDINCVSRFLAEARLGAQLIHPNIVGTHEIRSEGRRHYVALEFLDGRTLDRFGLRLTEHGRLSVGGHLRIISEALLGLHHAHELRGGEGQPLDVVHRDFGPRKVLVTFDGRTKVLHFGTPKTTPSSIHAATRVGRLAYVAPEQALDVHVDRRADVYAAGVMLWEAAAGRRLWPGMSDAEILAYALRATPPTLRSVQPEAPAELEAICERAMAKDRTARYATVADLLADLDAHLAHRTDTMTMLEIGAVLGAVFAEERRKMKTLLDDALQLRATPRASPLAGFGAEPSAERRPHRGSGSVPSPRRSAATTLGGIARSSHGSGPSAAVSMRAGPRAGSRSTRRERFALATLVSAGLVSASLIFAAAISRRDAPVPTSTPAPVFAAAAPRPTRPQAEVAAVHVAVTPLPTQAPIEDALVDVRGGAAPRWRTEFSPSQPSQPVHSAKRALPHNEAETPDASATAIEVSPAGGRAPLRPIVTTNPYGSP